MRAASCRSAGYFVRAVSCLSAGYVVRAASCLSAGYVVRSVSCLSAGYVVREYPVLVQAGAWRSRCGSGGQRLCAAITSIALLPTLSHSSFPFTARY